MQTIISEQTNNGQRHILVSTFVSESICIDDHFIEVGEDLYKVIDNTPVKNNENKHWLKRKLEQNQPVVI